MRPTRSASPEQEYCRRAARVAGLLAGFTGLLALCGWTFHIQTLYGVLPGYTAMRPNTALGLLLLGTAVCLDYEYETRTLIRRIVQLCAGMTVLIGLVTLLEYVLGTNLHSGGLLFPQSAGIMLPGKMALTTALNLPLLGCSLFFSRHRPSIVVSQCGPMIAGCLAIFNLVGYLYGIKTFYGLTFHTGHIFSTAMALPTACGFVLLSAGILLSRPDWGMMATITSNELGGVLSRRLLPSALMIPVALGWLRWQGQLKGLFDTAFGLTLFTSSNIVIFAILIWRSGFLLNRVDLKRADAETNLRESEASFRLLADAMPQIVWTAKPDGNVDYYNQRWYDYTGMTFEETKDWGWQQVLHVDDLQNCVDIWRRAFTTGGRFEAEYRFRRAVDCVYRWHLGRAVPVINSKGEIVRWFGTCTDVEDYKRIQAENEKLTEELEQRVRLRTAELETANQELKVLSWRLEASNLELQDFASVASHDLQEPLRKVQVFGTRLKNGYGAVLDVQGLDYLERMLKATARMHSLIHDLLSLSRVTSQSHPFERVDLSRIAQEVLSDLEVRIEETGALVELGHLPIVEADPAQMRQLLQNLIGNALKFRKPGQAPTVRIRSETAPQDGVCRVVIADDGIGFEEKYRDRIFAVFQRLHTRADYEGTGVGLAICRKIAHRHHGEITAESAPGRGSIFTVLLPLRPPDTESAGASDAGAENQRITVGEGVQPHSRS